MASPTPQKKGVSDIKSKLFQPALTSHFEVYFKGPEKDFDSYLKENGLPNFAIRQGDLYLMCSETVLPGSNLATHEINNDFTGVTERHVYRRLYDDRIDLTFYVDAVDHMPIRYFESWIKFIVNESIAKGKGSNPAPGSKENNFFYRVRYPEEYKGSLSVTKFEKDYKSFLTYDFVQAFPIAITSIPVSYDSSSLLKCTVSFSYIRYIVNPTGSGAIRAEEDAASADDRSTATSDPALQAAYNRLNNPLSGNNVGTELPSQFNRNFVPDSTNRGVGIRAADFSANGTRGIILNNGETLPLG